MLNTIQ